MARWLFAFAGPLCYNNKFGLSMNFGNSRREVIERANGGGAKYQSF
jgi:hypothetical protein